MSWGSSGYMSFEGSFHNNLSLSIIPFCALSKTWIFLWFQYKVKWMRLLMTHLLISLLLFPVLKKMPKSTFLLCLQLLALSESTRSTATSCISAGRYASNMSMNICFLPWFFFSLDRVTLSWLSIPHDGEHHYSLSPCSSLSHRVLFISLCL